ncbi:MAG: head GIN domain-containing protein [Pseudomonadota bacterium]
MKSRHHRFFTYFTAFGLLTACSIGWGDSIKGSGNVTTESRDVSDFYIVAFSTLGQVKISTTGQETLSIKAEDNLLPHLKSRIDDGVLYLETENNVNIKPTKPIEFTLGVKELIGLKLSGAGSIKADSMQGTDLSVRLSGKGSLQVSSMQGTNIATKLSGEGNINLAGIQGSDMSAKLSGVGSMTVAGQVDKLNLKLSGAGSYKGDGLQAREAKVKNSGVGSAVVNVTDLLDAKLSGVGSVEYIGSPEVQKSVSGIGSIKQR